MLTKNLTAKLALKKTKYFVSLKLKFVKFYGRYLIKKKKNLNSEKKF